MSKIKASKRLMASEPVVKKFLTYVFDEKQLQEYIKAYEEILRQKSRCLAFQTMMDMVDEYSKVGSTVLFDYYDKQYLNGIESMLEVTGYTYDEIKFGSQLGKKVVDSIFAPVDKALETYFDDGLEDYLERICPWEGRGEEDLKKIMQKKAYEV